VTSRVNDIYVLTGLENRDYGSRGSPTLTSRHPSILKKLALTSPVQFSHRFVVFIYVQVLEDTEMCTYFYLYTQILDVPATEQYFGRAQQVQKVPFCVIVC
jgi:hypothetical protein